MSEETTAAENNFSEKNESPKAEKVASSPAKSSQEPARVFLVPHPSVVFLYPTFIVSLIAAIGMTIWGQQAVEAGSRIPHTLSALFLGILAVNLIVLTLDFPRATVLTLFFIICTLVLGLVLVMTFAPNFIPWVRDLATGLHPLANASFFWIMAGVLGLVLITAKIAVQFDYWEVRQNELLHHHGLLSDLRRYPTEGLQIEKEINDVFEFMLLRSGKLILRPQGNNRDLVLENIVFIDHKEKELTKLLGARKVEIRT